MNALTAPHSDDTPPDRTPRSIEAEAALLGAMLVENRLIDRAADRIDATVFHEELHGRIFTTIRDLYAQGKAVGPVTLKPYFENDPALKELGGLSYLARLTGESAGLVGFDTFIDQIADMAKRRRALSHIDAARETILDPATTPEQVMVAIERAVEIGSESDTTVQVSAQGAIDRFLSGYNSDKGGVRCGDIGNLDALMSALKPKQFIVMAARPGMGKTAVALSYAMGAAKNGHGVLFVSMEMSAEELAGRMIANWSFDSNPIDYSRIVNGWLNDGEIDRIRAYRDRMDQLPLRIIDTTRMTPARLSMHVRRWKRRFAADGITLDLVIVDYLQLMRTDRKGDNRFEAISEISQSLKEIAKDHKLAVMALSQLSREVEKRENKRPMLSDLRESGQIEQDADMVLFLLRNEYYLEQVKPKDDSPKLAEWQSDIDKVKDQIEFILAKRRNGRIGSATGRFVARHQAVRNPFASEWRDD